MVTIDIARRSWSAVLPHTTGATPANFTVDDAGETVASSYGTACDRLAEIRAKYDPDNFSRLNHNITPRPSAPQGR